MRASCARWQEQSASVATQPPATSAQPAATPTPLTPRPVVANAVNDKVTW
jgi:hypothetical protein